jgi:hypothetical protein
MAGDLHLKRFRIQDCILRLTEKNLSLPVGRFDLKFALNKIPTAIIIPAFGKSVFGAGKWASLTDIQEKDAVDLIIKVNDIQTLLLSGYISHINTTDTSSMFSRRQSLTLKVTHRAVKLAGAPSSSFVYARHAGQTLNELSLFKTRINTFKPGPDGAKSIYSPNAVVAWLDEKGQGLSFFPGHVLKEIIKGLFEEYNDLQMSQEDLDTLIQTYDPANVSKILPDVTTFLLYIAEKFSSGWLSQNAWQSLVSTAKDLFLHIVPFNTGFYIANPYSLNRNPFRVIKAREYSKVGQGMIANLSEPRDGIVLLPPVSKGDGLADTFSFPNVLLGNNTLINKYYHYRTFPAWLQPSMQFINGALTAGKAFSPPPNPKFPQEKETLEEYYKLVGGNMARAMYGQIKQEQRTSTMVFPYRLDLMPGTNVQFEDSDIGLSFIGDTTYGMVLSTQFTCDASAEEPSLTTTVEVAALRNVADNADDKLTFNGHPIFEEQWVGIDIEGKLLKEQPDVQGPKDVPVRWFNVIKGVEEEKVKKEPEKPAPEQPKQAHGVSGNEWDDLEKVLLAAENIT